MNRERKRGGRDLCSINDRGACKGEITASGIAARYSIIEHDFRSVISENYLSFLFFFLERGAEVLSTTIGTWKSYKRENGDKETEVLVSNGLYADYRVYYTLRSVDVLFFQRLVL